MVVWIEKMFAHAEQRKWYETYWFIDLHGVISKPDYRKTVKEIEYYEHVKETLQYITKNRPDVIMILFTSSYPDELKIYMKQFEEDNIFFKYVNENPEITDLKGNFGCYDKKPYYNVIIDDKGGFDPITDWLPIYNYFLNTKYKPDPSWSFKTVESYHNSENVDMVTLNRPIIMVEDIEKSTWESYTDEEKVIKYFESLFGYNLCLIRVAASEHFKPFCEEHGFSREFVISTIKNYKK